MVSRLSETQKRERKRRARAAAEARAAARETKEEEARRARIAAMRTFTIDLQVHHSLMILIINPNPNPTYSPCFLPSEVARSKLLLPFLDVSQGPKPGDEQPIQTEPSTAEDTATATAAPTSGQGLESLIEDNLVPTERYDAPNAPTRSDGTEGVWSFARVTAMNGHFPSLPVAGTSPPKNTGARLSGPPVSKGAWESGTTETRNNSNIIEGRGSGVSNPGRGVWGTGKPETSGASRAESASCNNKEGTLVLEGGGGLSGKKKGRKAKAVSLFSNAGVRGGGR